MSRKGSHKPEVKISVDPMTLVVGIHDDGIETKNEVITVVAPYEHKYDPNGVAARAVDAISRNIYDIMEEYEFDGMPAIGPGEPWEVVVVVIMIFAANNGAEWACVSSAIEAAIKKMQGHGIMPSKGSVTGEADINMELAKKKFQASLYFKLRWKLKER